MPDARRYRARLTTAEKLNKASEYLRKELHLSPGEYIKLLFSQSDRSSKIRQKHFCEVAYTSPEVVGYLNANPSIRIDVLNALDWGIPELRNEISALAESPFFGPYHVLDKDIASLDPELLSTTISNTAPHISHLLKSIAQPPRSSDLSLVGNRLITMLAILCYSSRSRTSTNIPTLTGLYLHSKGVKRVVIELLHHFGITVSYDTILKTTKALSRESADTVAEAGQSPKAVTVYDNFEQMEGVKEQRVDNNSNFHSVTAGKVFQGLEMPSGGLQQGMLDPTVELRIRQVLLAPGNREDQTRQEVNLFNVLKAES